MDPPIKSHLVGVVPICKFNLIFALVSHWVLYWLCCIVTYKEPFMVGVAKITNLQVNSNIKCFP